MDLVFEIGTEELPASFQKPALEWMKSFFDQEMAKHGLTGAQTWQPFATPRRLAFIATKLPEGYHDETQEREGPPAKAGGKAIEGFAKKMGVPVESLRENKNGRMVATIVVPGAKTAEVLPGILERMVRGIPFKKSMRWDALESDPFARPVHWIVASLEGKLLPVSFADVKSGLQTRGHRFLAPDPLQPTAKNYAELLRKAHVLADWSERRKRIEEEVARAARETKGVPRPDEELLETVTGLVEEPHAVLGRFEEEFLQLPPEVLVSEMRGHQKYFAVQDERGQLLPAFVAVSNTKVRDPAVSRKGYERVLRARLSDGKFFFDEDRKSPLRSRLEKLGRRTFMQGLGTELERVQRLRDLALWLHGATGRGEARQLSEAAELCKCDLATAMVGEFPELQGVMGRVYALHDGVAKEVAEAIFDHYLPRGAEDRLPQSDAGALLGMADRIDQLVGIFGLGKEPTGTADPFGLRRAALGLLRVTLARGYRFDMGEALRYADNLYKMRTAGAGAPLDKGDSRAPEKVWQFLLGRLEVLLREKGQPDSIQAALHTGSKDVVALEKRLVALQTVREKSRAQFEASAVAFKRIANILAQAQEKGIAPMGFVPGRVREPGEKELAAALQRSRERVQAAIDEREDYLGAYSVLAELRPVLDEFFEKVLVMDKDPALRDNRLALLRALHEVFAPLADFARLQVEKSS
ncbi:MAG: glycine--tRNA ligase subunit beta [Deltaproteobacteria bacterium]|nr:MAG: glycine--tRNA ligase subunit beta [Deltaproteobacteria bacterium]